MPRGTRLTPHSGLAPAPAWAGRGIECNHSHKEEAEARRRALCEPCMGHHGENTFQGPISYTKPATWVPVAPPFMVATEIILGH